MVNIVSHPLWDKGHTFVLGKCLCSYTHFLTPSVWVMPPILATHILVVIVQNDCSQMLLIVCSPLPPTLSRAAWIVRLRCVFNWLPREGETTEDDRPTHHFLSLCVLVFCFAGWGTHSIKNLFPGYTENIKLLQSREVALFSEFADETFLHHTKDTWFN